jgi:hypothetical protein
MKHPALLSLPALITLALLAPNPASAIEQETSAASLVASELRASNPRYTTVMRMPDMSLRAGQAKLIVGQLAATSNVSRGPMMGARIICLGGGGGSTYTTTNHLGKSTGVQTATIRWLFIAPKDSTYTCELRGVASTSVDPDKAVLKLVPKQMRLDAATVNSRSREHGDGSDTCVGSKAIPDIKQCSVARRTATFLGKTVSVGTASTVNVLADVELSREYGPYPGGESKVRLTLRSTPLDRNGHRCGATTQGSRTQSISQNLHHVKPRLSLNGVPAYQSSSCGGRIRVDVQAKWLGGNPVTVHNKTYSNGIVLVR